jgi:hypothetical protein
MRAPRLPSARVAVAPRPAAAFVPLFAALWAAFAVATAIGLLAR